MIQGKIWGITQCLFKVNNVEIHRISINKDGFCSKHKHLHKYNAFFVESGSIKIEVWKGEYDLVDITELSAGDMTVVDPGEYHKFTGLEDSVVYEIYWVALDSRDIQREVIGGLVNNAIK